MTGDRLSAGGRRPRAQVPRRHDVRVRLSADEVVLLRDAARREGLALGAWLGLVAVRSARDEATPSPASWRELVAELVKLRAEVVRGREGLGGQVGPESERPGGLLHRVDAATAAVLAAARPGSGPRGRRGDT